MSGIVKGDVLTSSRSAPVVIPAAGFDSGTKMVFNQTAAPTGWTKVTGSGNDTALRVTTGTVGTGGSVAFETAFASHAGAAHTLATAEMPAHTHTTFQGGVYSGSGGWVSGYGSGANTGSTGGGGSHAHGSIDLNVSFVDVIIATKD
jgi:hypothetical protein